ncbi:MAG: cell division protein ZapA [Bacteroidales bacterium]|nr:cell division protein ZapA [Bacteroidales bacterium]
MNELTITVKIADRPYRLTIKKDEEEIIRKAAGLINEKVKNYSDNYAFKDKQDLIAMVALQNGASILRGENEKESKNNRLIDKMKEIDKALSENLL